MVGHDPADTNSQRLRARSRLLDSTKKLKTKDKLGLIASASVIADLVDQGWLIKTNRREESSLIAHPMTTRKFVYTGADVIRLREMLNSDNPRRASSSSAWNAVH